MAPRNDDPIDRSAPTHATTDRASSAAAASHVPFGDPRADDIDQIKLLREQNRALKAALAARSQGPNDHEVARAAPWLPRRLGRHLAHRGAQWEMLRRAVAWDDAQARAIITRSVGRRLSRLLGRATPQALVEALDTWDRYPNWLARFDTLQPADHAQIAGRIAAGLPRIGVVVRWAGGPDEVLRRGAVALAQQMLAPAFVVVVLAEGAPPAAEVSARAAFGDAPIVRNVGDLDENQETAEAILLLEASHILREHATVAFACERLNTAAAVIYADEDQSNPDGTLGQPFFKPRYAPRLAETGYMGRCGLVASSLAGLHALVERLAGDRGVRDLLRDLAAAGGVVAHIPLPLSIDTAPVRLDLAAPDRQRPRSLGPTPKVSIIIPSKNRLELLKPCIESILEQTAYERDAYEIVVVNNDTDDAQTLAFLRDGVGRGDFAVIDDQEPFNYPRLNNTAAAQATGDVLVFLNNDTIVIQPDWLARLADAVSVSDVGAVGVKLLYPDRTVQHAGVVLGIQGVAGHAHTTLDESAPGYHGLALADHEVSAVTGACLAMRKSVFEEIGGFDPAFAVAFNDTMLCLAAMARGYRNLVLNSVKLIHLESKTRHLDDTPERLTAFMREAIEARIQARGAFSHDAYYSPNLSLEQPYRLAVPPRRVKPWFKAARGRPSVLLLSVTHQLGHGVPVVLAQQARFLSDRGFKVFVGGPASRKDLPYPGCERVAFGDPQAAAMFAVENNIDCIVAHTPPFYSVARWCSGGPKTVMIDHGEPPPHLFADSVRRQAILSEKNFVFSMADRICAISPSVKFESNLAHAKVIPNANSHLAVWSEDRERLRTDARARHGWGGAIVILNVCRFQRTERAYKGVDVYIEAARMLRRRLDVRDMRIVFLLVGRADDKDIAFVEQQGIAVRANVTDSEMIALYAAADIYANFSKWEGYNLGIAQALAMGLPVVASDIPAHRMNFDITVASRPDEAVAHLVRSARATVEAGFRPQRRPIVTSWDRSLATLAAEIESVCAGDPSA